MACSTAFLTTTCSATSNTDEMRRREDNVDSALILRARAELQLRVCGRG